MSEMRTIQLPADLCAGAEKKFGQVFGSIEELLAAVLRDLLRSEARSADGRNSGLSKRGCANWATCSSQVHLRAAASNEYTANILGFSSS
jgi:hypothetical protein